MTKAEVRVILDNADVNNYGKLDYKFNCAVDHV